jgi:dihydropteroate synthase
MPNFTLNCLGKLLIIDEPIVMGIINATPDSFYKGNINDDILQLANKMIADGATILDIGGQSTKPNAITLSASEEIEKVVPVIEIIHKNYPNILISVDTFYSQVAKAAVKAGACIVNDISAGNLDAAMLATVASLKTPYVCMHMQGTPKTMQINPTYKNITNDVFDFFIQKIDACKKAGIVDIIIDPGFGFGKTLEHLAAFSILYKPILAGLSRKSMVYKPLQSSANEALNGTTALNTLALQNGASILRVHDVKVAKEAITLFTAYKNAPL